MPELLNMLLKFVGNSFSSVPADSFLIVLYSTHSYRQGQIIQILLILILNVRDTDDVASNDPVNHHVEVE